MKRLLLTAAFCTALAGHATGQTVNDCDWVSSARNLVAPWSQNTRIFANGAIRIALLDAGEPACCSFHLLVLSPDPEWGQACHVISAQPGMGWVGIGFRDQKASYDAAKGLRVNISVDTYDPDTGTADPANRGTVGIRINQATGQVTLE